MYNKKKVRLEGIVIPINILVLRITTTLDFQIIRNEIETYPMILGRLWLKKVHAWNYWK
jgi:hypothetical protein